MAVNPKHAPLIERGRLAALSIADSHGLKVENVELVHFGCNITYRMLPYDLVARVSGRAGKFSSHADARRREMEVSRYLAEAGAPVVSPSGILPAGPHEEDGLIISFWDYVEEGDIDFRKQNAVATLQECHAAFADYPGELPFLHGYADARRLFLQYWREGELTEREFRETLSRISEMDDLLARMKEEMDTPPVPLHGDSHLRNTICVGSGEFTRPLWIDWEDVCCGPVEWDYACLIVNLLDYPVRNRKYIRAIKKLVADHNDPARLDLLIRARELQIDVWDGIP